MTHNSAASKNSNDDSSGTRTPGSPEMNEKSDGGDNRNNDINVESIKEEKVSNMMNSSPMEQQMNKEGKNLGIFLKMLNFSLEFLQNFMKAYLNFCAKNE